MAKRLTKRDGLILRVSEDKLSPDSPKVFKAKRKLEKDMRKRLPRRLWPKVEYRFSYRTGFDSPVGESGESLPGSYLCWYYSPYNTGKPCETYSLI